MVFIETPVFTNSIQSAMSDESYGDLQRLLIQKPNAGSIIPGSGGLRKMRWSAQNTGKRGGVRVIYYWVVNRSVIYMLSVYLKSQSKDLRADQIRVLRKLVEVYLDG